MSDSDKNQLSLDSNLAVKRRKVILLYASAGAGHRSACEAIKQSLLELESNLDLKMIDILDYLPRLFSQIYAGGYLVVVSKYPMLWYFMYETGSDISHFRPYNIWNRMVWSFLFQTLFRFLRKENPDLIISAHFHASWAAGVYKSRYNPQCVVSSVVTDYGVHPVWVTPLQDYIFVATEQLKAELLPFSNYLGTEKIIPVGIPIKAQFGKRWNRAELRTKFKLDSDRHTILILGGMFGSESIKDILFWLSGSTVPLQIIIVAGKHYPITESIKERLVAKNIKYQLYGYIDFMDELMAVADLAITKAGALTTTECLASGLPLVVYRPYPGQEVRNCDYFLEQGVAVRVDQLSGLCYKIDSILTSPERLAKMREKAVATTNCDSAAKIAGILLDAVQKK